MKMIRNLTFCLGALLLIAPMPRAQELSKYRGFSIGTSMASVLKLTDQKLADVKTIHARPMLIQELTWWPPSNSGRSAQFESVQEILFDFSNGELFKISVAYARSSTDGLTPADMVKSISVKYGPATGVESEIDAAMNGLYNLKPGPLASWNDSQYSFDLVRTSLSDHFGLVIYSKEVNAAAELATAQAVKLEEQERPEKEAGERKKEAESLEVTREKNQQSFRP
jgi:hypothetical protein